MNKIKIDKDIPIPSKELRYPWNEMEVGDSIFLTPEHGDTISNVASRVRAHYYIYGRKTSKKFLSRQLDGGLRIWRIK